jgi:hypothetical protein
MVIFEVAAEIVLKFVSLQLHRNGNLPKIPMAFHSPSQRCPGYVMGPMDGYHGL